jgi:hypothetical protein
MKRYVLILGVVLLAGAAWLGFRHWRDRSSRGSEGASLRGLEDASLRVFMDDSSTSHRDYFLFSRDQVAAVRLGRRDSRVIEGYSAPLDPSMVSRWLTGDGNARPPFVPPGPWFTRIDFGEGEAQVFFKEDGAEIAAWLDGVRAKLFVEAHREEGVPVLFRVDRRVVDRTGVQSP